MRPPAPAPAPPRATALPLWPLPLVAGLLPAVAALLALALSVHLGLIPRCLPFVDGCVSISRAARHELPNHLFRALVLPAAALQGLTWLCAARWLVTLGQPRRWLAPLGLAAASALVLYGAFLGTEGATYRWLRQYGTVVYFGGTCLCMLITGGALKRVVASGQGPVPAALATALTALAGLLVSLGVVNAIVSPMLAEPGKDQMQNITEWWGAAVLVAMFLVLGCIWRRCGLRLRLQAEPPA